MESGEKNENLGEKKHNVIMENLWENDRIIRIKRRFLKL